MLVISECALSLSERPCCKHTCSSVAAPSPPSEDPSPGSPHDASLRIRALCLPPLSFLSFVWAGFRAEPSLVGLARGCAPELQREAPAGAGHFVPTALPTRPFLVDGGCKGLLVRGARGSPCLWVFPEQVFS